MLRLGSGDAESGAAHLVAGAVHPQVVAKATAAREVRHQDGNARPRDGTANPRVCPLPSSGRHGQVVRLEHPDIATAPPDLRAAQPDLATAQPDTATAAPDVATAQPDTATASARHRDGAPRHRAGSTRPRD